MLNIIKQIKNLSFSRIKKSSLFKQFIFLATALIIAFAYQCYYNLKYDKMVVDNESSYSENSDNDDKSQNDTSQNNSDENESKFSFKIGFSNVVVMAALIIGLLIVKKKDNLSSDKQKEK